MFYSLLYKSNVWKKKKLERTTMVGTALYSILFASMYTEQGKQLKLPEIARKKLAYVLLLDLASLGILKTMFGSEEPVNVPAQALAQSPAQALAQSPAQALAQAPAQVPTQNPAQVPTESPVNIPIYKSKQEKEPETEQDKEQEKEQDNQAKPSTVVV